MEVNIKSVCDRRVTGGRPVRIKAKGSALLQTHPVNLGNHRVISGTKVIKSKNARPVNNQGNVALVTSVNSNNQCIFNSTINETIMQIPCDHF